MPAKTTICTAIPYVNSIPHIGTALTTLSGDVTARYERLRGRDVFFVAGTDENGLKIKEAADAQGRDVHEFVDEIAGRYETIFRGLGIEYDTFVRTSKEAHREATRALFQRLLDNGHIYEGTYEGWYDVTTETFFKEADLVDGKSPDGNEVRWVSERNFFFRLSAFEGQLLDLIETNPSFILSDTRRNEVLAFIRQGLRDTAVSRANPGWGIPIPGHEDQVVYVWFDALINYITATGWPHPGWEEKWPALVQWVGKDILTRFHATLWPAMLMGAGLPVFQHVAAHGWILLGGEKISKSKGNVVAPLELAQQISERSGCEPAIGVDVVRHYLTAISSLETDSTFTYEDFDRRYNSDLANDLGNALNRSLAMAHKFVGGTVPDASPEPEALAAIDHARAGYEAAMNEFRLGPASDAALGLVRFLNKYIDTRAPWALAKAQDPSLPAVVRSMLMCLRAVETLMRPTMPTTADAIAAQLGLAPNVDWSAIGTPESLPAGTALQTPRPIFPRLDLAKPAPAATPSAKPEKPPKAEKPAKPKFEPPAEIGIEDVMRVQLRVGRILEAEAVDGSEKLVKCQVIVGAERRQILAGIRKSYDPADLVGRQVVVVCNLKPAKLMGLESQGMLLAADGPDGQAILLTPEAESPEGASVH